MNTIEWNPSANRHRQAVGGGASLQRLEAVAASDDAFPPLKLAVIKALGIIEVIKKFNYNKRAWIACSDTLIRKVEEIIQYTCQFREDQVPSALQSWLEDLQGTLSHLKEDVSDIHQQSLRKFPSFTQDKEYIEKFEGKINEAMSSFCVLPWHKEHFQSISNMKTTEQVKTTEANQNGQVTVFSGAQDIQMDHSIIIAGQIVHYDNTEKLQEKINGMIEESKENKWLQELRAPLHSKPSERCMPGTRVDVLTDIEAWVNDLSMPNILWLSGSPGSGKTTIASTVVAGFEHFSGQFFFHRDQAELRNPDNLWRCLALDLAQGTIALKTSIAQALEAQKANIRGLDISMQFEHLIVKPLQEVSQSSVKPLLLVVDALDECDSYEKLLPSLQSCSQLSKSLKLLVTSRRYPDIQSALDSVSYHIDLHAGDEVSDQTADDIWKYFTTRFLEGAKLDTSALYLNWPGLEKISFLVEKAAGLFIWAKSAMDFILCKGGDIQERLEVICSNSGEGTDAIDTLYHYIISAAFQGLRETEKNSLSSVLGSIVVAKNPLHSSDLEQLLGVRDALSIISQLSPIMSISETGHVQICHQSVTDFLLAPKRSQTFWVDSQKYSLCLAGYCLKFMNAVLKFNFFDLETSHVLNEDIPELENHIESVKSTALDHASHFWAIYLQRSSNETLQSEVMFQMEKFMLDHVLHWLEVMSLRDTVNHAAQLLLLAASWSRTLNCTISDFASDANRFIMEFIKPISMAAPHIYLSALPFAPKDSKISMHFLKHFEKTLIVQTGQMENWSDRCFLILEGHSDSVKSVAFSPDGMHIVSGSDDKTIRVWDSLTGQSVMNPLKGHKDEVHSVAFSPDGRYIISGSADKTIRVWDAHTGQSVMDPLRGHEAEVHSVVFSSDGRYIVSGSADKTLRVWDAQTGQSVMDPLEGHDRKVYSIAFSSDGRHIVSGSGDGTVRVWDFQGCQSVMDPCDDEVYSVAFSPDGRHVVSGCDGHSVMVWDTWTGQCVMRDSRGHPCPVNAVAFSPDGKHVVSVADSIRVWDTQTGQCMLSPDDGTGSIHSVAYSPCGRHIALGLYDGTVKLWDAQVLTGPNKTDIATHYKKWIKQVAFSPDGMHIASVSDDTTVKIWDFLTCQSAMDPLRGHTKNSGMLRQVRVYWVLLGAISLQLHQLHILQIADILFLDPVIIH
ncbi:uncharacterized protein LACBIDRAFT_396451 [Laccaria bicolor S238N-H82]|uniref:Predicted protein n=1 Tax=Laccaria bicolor (strain S238N-H82 / ATCC MYA-4686) TaxID=486041 RepID=B0DYY9_LACBS|nr:uncharacterized protein LACBIDRAFT_396451 [Laccaria bicolor S238N-H82]EDR00248.1 predicted protein [Laccaria bicolor S238N-H82]|eukprot:XP_001889157.1 predicted protein [Laccaria bicolor S238N-H82]